MLISQASLPPKGVEGQELFYTREKKKSKLSFSLWWWFGRILVSLWKQWDRTFLPPTCSHVYMHTGAYTHVHICTHRIARQHGPTPAGVAVLPGPERPLLCQQPGLNLSPQTQTGASTVAPPFPLAWDGLSRAPLYFLFFLFFKSSPEDMLLDFRGVWGRGRKGKKH